MSRKGRVIILLIVVCVFWASRGRSPAQAGAATPANPPLFWTKECLTCDQPIWWDSRVSLDIDQQGYPHVVADVQPQATNAYALMNFYQDDLGWNSQVIDNNTDEGFSLYLRLDSFGYEHVLYDESEKYIKYAYRDQSGWHAQRIFFYRILGQVSSEWIAW